MKCYEHCGNCAYCVIDDDSQEYYCEMENKNFDLEDGYCEEYCPAD